MSLKERLARISPFRWRLEWAALVALAVSGVLSEQAREAQARDPYALVKSGRIVTAKLSSPRETTVDRGTRRGLPQSETLLLVDLDWQDDAGSARRVKGYRLDEATAAGLRPDASRDWPETVQVQHLDRAGTSRPAPSTMEFITSQGTTAPGYQLLCEPWAHCRLIVLPPDALSPSEQAARNVDYVLERAPYAFQLSIALFALLLLLRFTGIVHNPPSLE